MFTLHKTFFICCLWLIPISIPAAIWERDIAIETVGQPLAAFALDSQVRASARFDLADLRLLDPARNPIGYVAQPLLHTRRVCEDRNLPMTRVQARALGEQGFEAIFAHFDSTAIPSKASFQIDGEDFEISVSLWTAAIPTGVKKTEQLNLKSLQWTERIQSEPLYDYSRMLSLRKEQVAWEPERDRLVKIQVSGLSQSQRSTLATLSGGLGQPNQESFQIATRLMRVEAISFTGLACHEAVFSQALDTAQLNWVADAVPEREPEQKRSWYRFHSGGLPLQSLLFQPAPGNFMRSVQITGWPDSVRRGHGDSTKPWTWPVLAEGSLRRIDWGASRDSSLDLRVSLPERMKVLAIGIHDRDDPPLVLAKVQGVWGLHQVFFPVGQAGTYHLQLGQHGRPYFQSEFTEMFRKNSAADYMSVHLAAVRLIDSVGNHPGQSWISSSVLFTIGLVAGILVLLALLFGVAKKAKGLS